jgi:hypothetical protein
VGRIRTLKPEIAQSATLGRVPRDARLCFILLFTLADDHGRMRGDPLLIASLLFPYDRDARELIVGWLESLVREGAVQWYEAGGQLYLQIAKWASHQRVEKPRPSTFPAPPDGSTGIPGSVADASAPLPGTVAVGLDQGVDGIGSGEGPRALAPVVIMPAPTPRYMKPMGGKHGDCLVGCRYGMCLHEKQAMDLAAALPGGFSEEGLASVVKWAESVVADYAARGEGRKDRNEWRFWDNRWEQQWGGSAPSFGEMRAKRQSAAFGDEVVNG